MDGVRQSGSFPAVRRRKSSITDFPFPSSPLHIVYTIYPDFFNESIMSWKVIALNYKTVHSDGGILESFLGRVFEHGEVETSELTCR